jgi:hypothetical protein
VKYKETIILIRKKNKETLKDSLSNVKFKSRSIFCFAPLVAMFAESDKSMFAESINHGKLKAGMPKLSDN